MQAPELQIIEQSDTIWCWSGSCSSPPTGPCGGGWTGRSTSSGTYLGNVYFYTGLLWNFQLLFKFIYLNPSGYIPVLHSEFLCRPGVPVPPVPGTLISSKSLLRRSRTVNVAVAEIFLRIHFNFWKLGAVSDLKKFYQTFLEKYIVVKLDYKNVAHE
jgi:hypothetical protein